MKVNVQPPEPPKPMYQITDLTWEDIYRLKYALDIWQQANENGVFIMNGSRVITYSSEIKATALRLKALLSEIAPL